MRKALARTEPTYTNRRRAQVEALAKQGIVGWGRLGLSVWVPVAEESATVQGLLAQGYGVAAGERFRLASPPAIRISITRLDEGEAPERALALARRVTRASGRMRHEPP